MARLIDNCAINTTIIKEPMYCDAECTIIGGYRNRVVIAKPIKSSSIISKLKDAIGVIVGKYDAVYYEEDILKSATIVPVVGAGGLATAQQSEGI